MLLRHSHKKIYANRFNSRERIRKNELWKILCSDFLQQFIHTDDTVVDVGAGYCEFINNIKARKKIAIDTNPALSSFAGPGVQQKLISVTTIKSAFAPASVNVLFMSNLLEHLDTKEIVFNLLQDAYFLLKPGGKLLILQPDIRLAGAAYWDFFDHKVPITYASLQEALILVGFRMNYTRYPFLPYSTKVKLLPLWSPLLRFYLQARPLHYLFGKQFFICAVKP